MFVCFLFSWFFCFYIFTYFYMILFELFLTNIFNLNLLTQFIFLYLFPYVFLSQFSPLLALMQFLWGFFSYHFIKVFCLFSSVFSNSKFWFSSNFCLFCFCFVCLVIFTNGHALCLPSPRLWLYSLIKEHIIYSPLILDTFLSEGFLGFYLIVAEMRIELAGFGL